MTLPQRLQRGQLRPRRRRGARIRLGLGLLTGLLIALVGTAGGPASDRAAPAAGAPTRTDGTAAAAPGAAPVLLAARAPARRPGSAQPGGAAAPTATSAAGPSTPGTAAAPPRVALAPAAPPGTPTSQPPAASPNGGDAGCGLLEVTCHVTSAINGWFTSLVTSALTPILGLLAHSVLATPALTGPGRVADLWSAAAALANTLLVLLVLAGGAVVMGHETLQTRYAAKDIAPRIVVAVIAANASLSLAGIAIDLANSLSVALLGPGIEAGHATGVLTALVAGAVASGGMVAVLGVVLLAGYVIRIALLVLLIAGAPLALVCHALPHTDPVARLWWRAVAGLLAVQVAQTLVLASALRVFFAAGGHATLGLASSGGVVDLLVASCLLYVLVKIPAWVARIVFARTGHTPSSTVRAVKTVVLYKALRAGTAVLA